MYKCEPKKNSTNYQKKLFFIKKQSKLPYWKTGFIALNELSFQEFKKLSAIALSKQFPLTNQQQPIFPFIFYWCSMNAR
jgi:hypothetical protein